MKTSFRSYIVYFVLMCLFSEFLTACSPTIDANALGGAAGAQETLLATYNPTLELGERTQEEVKTTLESTETPVRTPVTPQLEYTRESTSTITNVVPSPTSYPSPLGQIAFVSNRDGNYEIYKMNADGSAQQRLTNNSSNDQFPAWSPDGHKIAFSSDRDGDWEIYLMEADGTNIQQLTNNTVKDWWPSWSPDGSAIAFESYQECNWDLYVFSIENWTTTRLTNEPSGDAHPKWSPDGNTIAFVSFRNGNGDIYTMKKDGSEIKRITLSDAADADPVWSPDGKYIAYQSWQDGNAELYISESDGSNPARLTQNPAYDGYIAWSRNNQIAFLSDREGEWRVFTIRIDTLEETPLTTIPVYKSDMVWSPDGLFLTYIFRVDGRTQVGIIGRDGTVVKQLTDPLIGSNSDPVWH